MDIVLDYFFSSLKKVHFYYLNIFKIADLKSLSSRANTWASSGKVFIDFLPPPHFMGHTFLFLCTSCLLLKNAHLK